MKKNVTAIMRVTTVALGIIIGFSSLIYASVSKAQKLNEVKVTISIKNENMADVLARIETSTGISFSYDKNLLGKLKVSLQSYNGESLSVVLKNLLKNTGYDYEIINNNIVVGKAEPAPKPPRPGRISGKILDDKGETLPGASIKVVETGVTTQSGADGSYTLNLPPDTYTLQISYISFATQRITGVTVTEDKNTPLDIAMKPDTKGLKEVVVTSSYKKASIDGLYARQKNNAAVSDGITAEQISRTPDNNTAQVLKRISGLQVSDGKYVVIRGLSDRYNNVLLNGVMLPSSEPNKRNFSFDMVPSAILDRVIVNKTATPDLTGEFTGGLVQIETKDIPTEDFFQVTVGTGYNSQSTGKDMIGLDRGKNAWIGFASDVHKKPTGMTFGEYSLLEGQVGRLTTPANNLKRQQMHKFLGTMPDNWMLRKYTAMPTQNYQLQMGRVIPFKNESRLGLVAALTYRNEQNIENRSLYAIYSNDFKGTNNKYATTLGGSLNIGYQFGKHKLTFQNTFNRKFSDDMWKFTGVDGDNSNLRHDDYVNVTVINQLFQSQLGGEHIVGKRNIKIDWFASGGFIDRDQPYSRQVARLNGDEQTANYPSDYFSIDLEDNRLKNGNLFFSELKEKVYNWAANLQVPFKLVNLGQTLKMGYQGKYRTADFGANLFRMYKFGDGSYPMGTPYDQVFTQENFGKDLYLHVVNGQGVARSDASSAEGYDGFQRLNAGYAMLDLKLIKQLRLVGGMRVEKNDQNVYDFVFDDQSQTTGRKLTNNQQTDWLPSVNAVYSISDKLNFRAAWYKTVARPDLRELSSFSYWDYDLFQPVTGAPLHTTKINNADLRLEYYPAPGEVISVSAFYKKFKNPIEMMVDPTSGGSGYRYANLESASDKGLEVDFRKSLDFIGGDASVWQNLYLSGNLTLLDASVTFLPTTSVDEDGNPVYPKRDRPLAGQSPYIINGGLQYAGKTIGLNLVYNRYGKRIVFAAPDRSVDEYENPRDLVDLQVSYKFLKQKRAEFRLNISDLLNQEQIFYKNQFDLNNPLGFSGGGSSVEPYPGVGNFSADHKDPKGTSFNKDFDTVARRYKFGTTYTLNFTYRF